MGKALKIIGGIGSIAAAPFTAGTSLAWLPAALGGASMVGSLMDRGKGGPSPTSTEGGLLQTQQDAIKQGMSTASEISPMAKGFLQTSSESFNPVIDYWSRILGGNRGAAMSMLAPQIQQIQESGQKAGNAATWLSPRSGTTAAGREAAIYGPQRATSALLQTARPEAARNLLDVGSRAGSIGAGAYGAAASFLGGASRGSSDALSYLMRRNQDEFERAKQIGGGIWDLLKQVPFDKLGALFGGGKMGTPPITPMSGGGYE